MMKSSGGQLHEKIGMQGPVPQLGIKKLGIVSRDYNHEFPNGYYDFSFALAQILKLLDKEKCDAVLFSLYSIISRKSFDLWSTLNGLKQIKAVFLKEFQECECGERWNPIRNVVYHCLNGKWHKYELQQAFGRLSGTPRNVISSFVAKEMPNRFFGNCFLLLCGESNGVYARGHTEVEDKFGLRAAIPHGVNIVLNPVHDRMRRPEMVLKRQFLSENGRWVVSVWNKGKADKNDVIRNFPGPEWTVYHDGKVKTKNIEIIPNPPGVKGIEIGILDVAK